MNTERSFAGLAIRREMLGAEYVDKAMSEADEFSQPFQELVNEYCYGATWARPGIPRQLRSLITLGLLSALNHPEELRMHIHAAIRNGAKREEIMEVFLQVTLYCGMPCGREAFKAGREVFAELDRTA